MKLNWITKLVPLAVLAIGLTSLSLAQTAGPTGSGLKPNASAKGKRGPAPVQVAINKLNPSKELKKTLHGFVKTRNENVKAFRTAHLGDKAAIKAYTEDQQKTMLSSIKGALTADQWTQFQADFKAAEEAARAGRKHGGVPPTTSSSTGTSSGTGSSSASGASSGTSTSGKS